MLRRSTGTIQFGHLDAEVYEDMHHYWECLIATDFEKLGFIAGSFALEIGERTQRVHIQFYVEHKRKRLSTLVTNFNFISQKSQAVFQTVIDAVGSWEYCTGTGKYEGKECISRHKFGVPKLYGTSAKADLKMLVDLVISGDTLDDIMQNHPYSFCVHQHRLVPFYERWLNRTGRKDWGEEEG